MTDKTKPQTNVLSPREVKEFPNGLILFYEDNILPDGNFELHASRLGEAKSGRVQGEISLLRTNGTGKTHALLVPQWFDFMSNSYKSDLERMLRTRMPEVDWTSVIDDTCYRAITHIRKGAPEFEEDSTKITLVRPEFLLYPFLAKGQPNILFGRKGSCKSTLTLLMAICLSSGWTDNPWLNEEIGTFRVNSTPLKILWLDWETDREGWEYDLKRLCDGNGRQTDNIIYRRCRGPLVNQIERLKELKEKYKCELVIVDSIAPACGGEIKEAGVAIAYHDALRYFGCTTASVGHPTKADQREASVTGAGQFEDLARNVWEVVYEEDEDNPTGHQGLLHRKNYKTGFLKSVGFRYEFSEEMIIVNKENPKLISKAVEKMSDPVKVLEYLKTGAKNYKEICELLDKKGNYIYTLLHKMVQSQKITKLDTGKWGRTYFTPEPKED